MHCVCRLQVFHETDPGPCQEYWSWCGFHQLEMSCGGMRGIRAGAATAGVNRIFFIHETDSGLVSNHCFFHHLMRKCQPQLSAGEDGVSLVSDYHDKDTRKIVRFKLWPINCFVSKTFILHLIVWNPPPLAARDILLCVQIRDNLHFCLAPRCTELTGCNCLHSPHFI